MFNFCLKRNLKFYSSVKSYIKHFEIKNILNMEEKMDILKLEKNEKEAIF